MDWVISTAYFHSAKMSLATSSVLVEAIVVLGAEGRAGPIDFVRLVYRVPSRVVL